MNLQSLKRISGLTRGKQSAVVDALLALAQKLGPGAKLPTTRALSRALGVTGATLTRGLEQLEARGVLRCLQGSGIYVEAGVLQKRIAIVFGENILSPGGSEFGSLLFKRCAKRAAEHDEQFSFFLDNPAFHGVMNGVGVPAHQDLSDALKQGKIDGLLLVARSSAGQEAWLRGQGIPVVRVGARLGSLSTNLDAVSFDYEKLISLGVSRLAESGCRTLGLLGSLQEHGTFFRKALEDHGLQTSDRWVSHPGADDDAYPSDVHEQMGREAAQQLMVRSGFEPETAARGELPDGILITDDIMALGALEHFARRGVEVGGRLKIASHTNKGSSLLSRWHAKIISLQFDPDKLAVSVLDCLESLMKGNPSVAPILIPPTLGDDEMFPFPQPTEKTTANTNRTP